MEWEVSSEESGLKLVDFLHRRFSKYSIRSLKASIEKHCCKLNGKIERFASARVGKGDKIEFFDEKSSAQNSKITLIYQDESFIILNKPSGMTSTDPLLIALIPNNLSLILVHRLDKETSGALIFAKSERIYKNMIELFRNHAIKKRYLAVVDGSVAKNKGIIDNYLIKHSYQGQAFWVEGSKDEGLHARTEWEVLFRANDASILSLKPITGRTHQLRVHCQLMGHSILGDHHYGRSFKYPEWIERCMLHAHEIEFEHPVTGKLIHAKAEIPEDMQKLFKLIGKA